MSESPLQNFSQPSSQPVSPAQVSANGAQLLAESRRRQLVKLLGVEPLISRFDPVGAAATVRLCATASKTDISDPSTQRAGSAPANSQHPREQGLIPGKVRAEMEQLRSSLGGNTASPKAKSAPVLSPGPDGAKGVAGSSSDTTTQTPIGVGTADKAGEAPSVSFSLLLATCGRWLWIEALEDGLVRREQLQLIHGMAQAIDGCEVKLTHRQFDWPIASHPHLPKDLNAARQSVAGQSQRLAKDSGAGGVIVLGDHTGQYLLPVASLKRVDIPSTLNMLRDPTLKKQAWQVLKPLSTVD